MKTLIIYASTYGYTKDCVEELKKQLRGEVFVTDVMAKEIPSIKDYDCIIIGGSIYMGQIHKKLKLFSTQNLNELLEKKLALFLCCGLPENFEETLKNNFPKELIKKAVAKECFGGELRTDKMNIAHKMITGLMKKAAAKDGKPEPKGMRENILKLARSIN